MPVWVPHTFPEFALIGLILSNALVWDRIRRLENRFSKQFEEVPRHLLKKG